MQKQFKCTCDKMVPFSIACMEWDLQNIPVAGVGYINIQGVPRPKYTHTLTADS